MINRILLFVFCVFVNREAITQTLVTVPERIHIPENITDQVYDEFFALSMQGHAMKKYTALNTIQRTALEGYTRWSEGTWLRGYSFEDRGGEDFWTTKIGYSCGGRYIGGGYYSTHPLIRVISKMIRSHIHTGMAYPELIDLTQNNYLVRKGIDYLIWQQQTVPNDPVEDGGYTWWQNRPAYSTPNTDEGRHNNFTHAYETSHALRTMCEAYMYFETYNVSYSNKSALMTAIRSAANNVVRKNHNEGGACDLSNSNFKGLALWALSSAYKVTKDPLYLNKAYQIADRLLAEQNTSGTLADGMWLTGGSHNEFDCSGNPVEHDTRINYHAIVLRGLVEMMDITPNTNASWKIRLIGQIKKAVNHMINYRIAFYDDSPNGIPQGSLRTTWLSTNGGTTCPSWQYFFSEEIVEPIALLTLYSNYQAYFSNSERKSLRNLLLLLGKYSSARSTNLGYLENYSEFAHYASCLKAFDGQYRFYPSYENTQFMPSSGGRISVNDREDQTLAEDHQNITESNIAFAIYPNPASDFITYDFPLNAKSSIIIINSAGIEVIKLTTNENSTIIDCTDIPNGLYMVKVIGHNCYITRKIIVSH